MFMFFFSFLCDSRFFMLLPLPFQISNSSLFFLYKPTDTVGKELDASERRTNGDVFVVIKISRCIAHCTSSTVTPFFTVMIMHYGSNNVDESDDKMVRA